MSGRNPIEALARLRHEFGEHGGVNMSIEASSTFTVMEPGTMPAMFQGLKGHDAGCYLYGRHFNPTVYHLGLQLAAIEGTEAAYCTASGMGAISATLLALCKSGDHIVASNAVYGGSYALMHDFLPKRAGITVTFVDITDLEAVRNAITDRTRVVYTESMSNPTLRIADIPKLSSMAREAGIPLVVDNTFSPLILSPVDHGADIVVHSITKFISGMSDVIAGAVCGTKEFIESLMDLHEGSLMLLGPTMDPKERLDDLGVHVCYPGLDGHPDRGLLDELRCPDYGYGGVMTIDMGAEAAANALMSKLQNKYGFGFMAVSLGYFDTLMSCSGSSTSSEMSDENKAVAGISPGLVRMSVGYTGTLEQRWQQLRDALHEVDRQQTAA
jgi:methionine-gamma-lyase